MTTSVLHISNVNAPIEYVLLRNVLKRVRLIPTRAEQANYVVIYHNQMDYQYNPPFLSFIALQQGGGGAPPPPGVEIPNGAFIGKITNDAREEEMEENMEQVSQSAQSDQSHPPLFHLQIHKRPKRATKIIGRVEERFMAHLMQKLT